MNDFLQVGKQPVFYWHLELSSKCTLKCPRCPRTEKRQPFKVTELSIDFIKKLFNDELLSQTEKILICGGQGDPIYCKDFIEIISYLKKSKPDIYLEIVTNGSHKKTSFWKKVSQILNDKDTLIFSVDGWDNNSNNKYRVNSNFESIINGIDTVSSNNELVNIVWSTIIFSFNQNHLDKIKDVATQSGASYLQIVKSTLFGSMNECYIDQDLGYDPLEPVEDSKKTTQFYHSDRDLLVKLTDRDKKTTNKTYNKNVVDLYYNIKEEFRDTKIIPSCLTNERALYVDAEGILYPCSWISHPFGLRWYQDKVIEYKDSLFVKYKEYFNLHNFSYKDILNGPYYKKLHDSFKSKDKVFVECSKKCGIASSEKRMEKYLSAKDSQESIQIFNNLKKH